MKVIELLNSTINVEEEHTHTAPATQSHQADWSAQNIVDANQQLEIDALKAEIALLKATPRTETSTGMVKTQSTFGRHFNRTVT